MLKETVERLLALDLDISEIKRRAVDAGWTVAGVNKSLRELGVRQRGERNDAGAIRKELSATDEANRIIHYHHHNLNRALAFVEQLRDYIASRKEHHRP